ncbi:aldo/keto reductase [Fulvivirgaceae bacterium BMA12]|uniref:Aldo/keto reductase n=1 Tax=Agaribacillus aureus TaxID=3051825 RepID=A0ABT8L8L1_9BACT|nr:aldo/keto reductase [Fulvivirgaceae bacterium BMA12]
MNYRTLGNTDLKISEISFGCMSLGHNQQENDRIINYAIDHGINFFDTADLYQKGLNEQSVGKAIKSKRKDIVLSSKVGNVWNDDGQSWHWDASKKHIMQGIEGSLSRLQTDYIDLYQLHGGTIDDPIDETIEAFERLKQQGKIKYYGISSIRPNVIREYVKRSNIVSVMMQYSLLDRRPEEAALELLKSNQISVLARGSLAKGLLAGKPPATYLDHTTEAVNQMQGELLKIAGAEENGYNAALQFVLNNPAVASAVVGLRTMEQLQQILAYKANAAEADVDALKKIFTPQKYTAHR